MTATEQLAELAFRFDGHVKGGLNPVEAAVIMGVWTQGDLARASGLEASSITRIKQGKQRMTKQQRAAILWALAGRCLR